MVCIDNIVYLAHRVVYYLRTEVDPINTDILHETLNKDKDNRLKLIVNTKYSKKRPADTQHELYVPFSC